MSDFYSNMDKKIFRLFINQYLIVYDANNPKEAVDRLCWTGSGYRHLSYETFNSNYFGTVKPIKNDVY
jgi:hypothetical protein